MGLLDNLGNLANQFAAGHASDADVHSTYDQVAQAAPKSSLADALTHAFQSDQTPPFEQMLTQMFNQSNPEQKAGILNQILSALGPNAASLLGSAGLGGLAASLTKGGAATGGVPQVTPQQAQQVPPQTVEVLAQKAAKKDPSIVDQASAFYAQHPTLVKAIGAGALALLLSHMSRR
jgi:hypothetical protein